MQSPIVFLGVMLLSSWLAGAAMAADKPPTRAECRIAAGKVEGCGPTLRVRRHSRVEVTWTADQGHTLHLHGYDLLVTVEPGRPAVLAFKADIAGRFPVELHERPAPGRAHGRVALLYIEVVPR
jgi:hypothetical protein